MNDAAWFVVVFTAAVVWVLTSLLGGAFLVFGLSRLSGG